MLFNHSIQASITLEIFASQLLKRVFYVILVTGNMINAVSGLSSVRSCDPQFPNREVILVMHMASQSPLWTTWETLVPTSLV